MILNDQIAPHLECPEGQKTKVYWDDGLTIFGVRCTSGGPNMWVARDGTKNYHLLAPVEAVTCREAKEHAISRVREATLGINETDPEIHEILDRWHPRLVAGKSENTIENYDYYYRMLKEVVPKTARVSQAEVYEHASSWERRLKQLTTEIQSARILMYLGLVMEREGYTLAAGVNTTTRRKRRPRVLSWGETQALWDALEDLPETMKDYGGYYKTRKRKSVFWQICLTSPIRPWSELLPRKWEDVVEIPGAGTVIELDARKNEAGLNTEMRIYLDPLVEERLMGLPVTKQGWMWPNKSFTDHIGSESYLTWLNRAVKRAGIRGKLQPKDLRHTAATRLSEAGIDRTLQEVLSGATSETLQRVYQRPTIDAAFAAQKSIGYFERLGLD